LPPTSNDIGGRQAPERNCTSAEQARPLNKAQYLVAITPLKRRFSDHHGQAIPAGQIGPRAKGMSKPCVFVGANGHFDPA
jgi:hypothetical protein